MLPCITVTDGTPQKTPTDAQYRLLYRGALSLPDSYLLLDGIAFSARLPPQDPPSCSLARTDASAKELMFNPLALALESMRGRQSLRFKGTVCLQDVWTDDSGDVYMDVHPHATVTRIYFENVLCLSPRGGSGLTRTEVGVRVSLGDTDGPETTDIVIYGEASALLRPPSMQLASAATSASAEPPPPLSMRVARITPAPRAPRPDDPTPRKPPARLFGDTTLGDLGASKRIIARPAGTRAAEKTKADDHVLRRAKEVMLRLPRSEELATTNGVRDAGFKVPEVPAKARRKQGDTGTDVFGAVEPPRPRSVHGNGKAKAEDGETGRAIEDANKLVLKKLSVLHLANAGIPRSHDEFKDVFGFVYRGAAFALRSQLKTRHVSAMAAEAVVEAHVKLYVANYDPAELHTKTSSSVMDVDDAGG